VIKKYSVTIAGHATSITLEPEFWDELKRMATAEKTSLAALITAVDSLSGRGNLSSALRLRVLNDLKKNQP
jgi:predicted DNA-binding ribbon-helix-helix protein